MPLPAAVTQLRTEGLQRFQDLRADAVSAVTERFYSTHGSAYESFGPRGREACREDLASHLEFLRPALEFGLLQPMVDYLCWLDSVLTVRRIPAEHLTQSLDWLSEFFTAHLEAQDAVLVVAALQAARAGFLHARTQALAPPTCPESWLEAAAFEAALLGGKQRESLAIVDRLLGNGHHLVDIELHVIQPALYRIGEAWQANRVSVAQEHVATAIAQAVMTAGLLRSPPATAIDRSALLACVEGNHHEVGLRMVADALQLAGWEVQYLGANVPTRALVAHVIQSRPHLLGLSVSFAQQLRAVQAIITQLEEHLGNARPGVMLGGLAVNRFEPLARMVGADTFSPDAKAALVAVHRLAADRP